MTRTRLRGLEIAGVQMGIEVPDFYDWEWPESPVAEFICLPREPEVHIGLRVCDFSSADLGGECYGLGAWTFEVASYGDGWLLGLSRRGVRDQLATFDRDFRNGEILVSRAASESRRFPLRTPLDEWIVLHRTVARGGLCLNGSATAVGSQASIQLGTQASNHSTPNRLATPRMGLLGRDTVLLREEGGELKSFDTPWNDSSDPLLGYSTRVSEIIITEEAERPYQESLDPDDAAELLVTHAVVPLCDDALLDRTLGNARKIAERTRVVRCGEFVESTAPIAWQSSHLQHAFAPPSSTA